MKKRLWLLAVCLTLWGCEALPTDNTAINWAYVQTLHNGYCVAIDTSPVVGECLTGIIKDPQVASQVSKELNAALAKARSFQEK